MAQWVKLFSSYYLDQAVANLSDPAEVLFTRAIAYCGAAESHGFVPTIVLPGLIRNATPKRVKALCEELASTEPEPLWLAEPGGYRLRKWEDIQTDLESILLRRQTDAQRQRNKRARDKGRSEGVT